MYKFLLSFVLLLFSSFIFADTQKEINHLLGFVEKTNCSFNRNGTSYNGGEARTHIQKKYDYYQDDIKSAEDFIEYSATKSMISGRKYIINCLNKEEMSSQVWLTNELKKYRSQMIKK